MQRAPHFSSPSVFRTAPTPAAHAGATGAGTARAVPAGVGRASALSPTNCGVLSSSRQLVQNQQNQPVLRRQYHYQHYDKEDDYHHHRRNQQQQRQQQQYQALQAQQKLEEEERENLLSVFKAGALALLAVGAASWLFGSNELSAEEKQDAAKKESFYEPDTGLDVPYEIKVDGVNANLSLLTSAVKYFVAKSVPMYRYSYAYVIGVYTDVKNPEFVKFIEKNPVKGDNNPSAEFFEYLLDSNKRTFPIVAQIIPARQTSQEHTIGILSDLIAKKLPKHIPDAEERKKLIDLFRSSIPHGQLKPGAPIQFLLHPGGDIEISVRGTTIGRVDKQPILARELLGLYVGPESRIPEVNTNFSRYPWA